MTTTHAEAPQSLVNIGRFGWAVRGLVYLSFGAALWAVVISGDRGRQADTKGGIDLIADVVPDWWLLGIAVGLVAYSLWRLTEAASPIGDWTGKALVMRAGFLFSAGVYGALAWISWQAATGDRPNQSGGGGGGSALLSSALGRLAFGAAGLIAIGAGIYFARQGLKRSFEDHLDESRLPADGGLVRPLGVVGHLARGVVYAVVGVFVVGVAIRYDTEEARSVDQALTEVGQTWWGRPLMGLTAVGLLAYGLYCVVSAPGQRFETPQA